MPQNCNAEEPNTSDLPRTKFEAALFASADVMPLACFRIFFGAVMMYHVASYFYLEGIDFFYVTPQFNFAYPGFGWVKPWAGQGMYIHFGVMGLAAFGILTGCLYRFSAAVFAVCVTHVFLMDRSTYQNHYYLICLLSWLMVFAPANRMWSIDAWWKPETRSQTAPRIWLWLLRFQLGIAYFYGGIAKINYDWLHGMPMRIWLEDRTWLPVIGPWLTQDSAVSFFVWGSMLFDLAIVPALLWRRTRMFAFALAVAFHFSNSILWDIGIFPWFMIGATVLFFPDDAIRKSLFRRGLRTSFQPKTDDAGLRKPRLLIATVSVYLAWQLLFPFRHFLYPGNASWTGDGDEFAWRMMLNQHEPAVLFFVQDSTTHKPTVIDVNGILNSYQFTTMTRYPKMILQFAHFIRDQHSDSGEREVEIRVLALNSLNGRKPQLLMDPTIDYAKVKPTWGTQSWIIPLHEPLPQVGYDIPRAQWNHVLGDVIPEDMRIELESM